MDLVDSKVAILSDTLEGLGKMDASSKLISVKHASDRIKRTAAEIECDNEKATSLQRCIEEFTQRIIPVFAKAEAQTKQLEELRTQLSHAQGKVKAFETVCEESRKKDKRVVTLSSDLQQVQRDLVKTVTMTEKAMEDLSDAKRQNEVNIADKENLEKENRKLRGLLELHTKSAHSQKEKMRKMKNEITELKQRNDTLEEESQSIALEESLAISFSDNHDEQSIPSSSFSSVHFPSSPGRTPHRSSGLSQITNELNLEIELDEGMPGPRFSSDWKMNTEKALKRKASSLTFPIPLDKRGRPTVNVQTGPVRLRRIPNSNR
ncbi:hypothetical protein BDP27DRAFT_1445100 [Rhodocollybia butyracea]|uniref:Uncharacterized protein n=1 Tax=Rhodocollybia butyracea TaxID=206335 RepID=A0A9P5Q3Z6_9AGAR|nr:hypothetical protein BDP27DRAFT_1445100 [Rhodocollybia butyracea]